MKAFIIGSSFIVVGFLAACGGGGSAPAAAQGGANDSSIKDCPSNLAPGPDCPQDNCATLALKSDSLEDTVCQPKQDKCNKSGTYYCYDPATNQITKPIDNGSVPVCDPNLCGSGGCGPWAITTNNYTCAVSHCFDAATMSNVCTSGGQVQFPVPTSPPVGACPALPQATVCVGQFDAVQCNVNENDYSFALGAGECPATDGSGGAVTMCEYETATSAGITKVDPNISNANPNPQPYLDSDYVQGPFTYVSAAVNGLGSNLSSGINVAGNAGYGINPNTANMLADFHGTFEDPGGATAPQWKYACLGAGNQAVQPNKKLPAPAASPASDDSTSSACASCQAGCYPNCQGDSDCESQCDTQCGCGNQ